jgi:myo-inositol-1(or 4)-monophosphatase
MALRSALINVMVRAAEKAAKVLLRDFGEVEQLQVSRKGVNDFVTNADHKSEKILREELSRARPEFGFLTEESGASGDQKSERWIVDPLDGTKNFMHGVPLWAITIAAERDGEVIAGVTYEPVTDHLFWAERGIGAFVNNQRLRVSARGDLGDALVHLALGFSRNPTDSTAMQLQEAVVKKVAGTRRFGCSSLGLAFTAAGRFEACLERTQNLWDVAAGLLMVREAGGRISTLEDDVILASNFHVHQPLVDIVKTAR